MPNDHASERISHQHGAQGLFVMGANRNTPNGHHQGHGTPGSHQENQDNVLSRLIVKWKNKFRKECVM